MKIIEPSVSLLVVTPNPEETIEQAGRTCYKSEDKITEISAGNFVRKIIARGHDSVLEHASATFKVVCDRGISHEFVRSRIGFSYSQESTRYCNYSKDKFGNEITVICPAYLRHAKFEGRGDVFDAYCDWVEACHKSEEKYIHMIQQCKTPPQIARSILPTCLKTEIAVTANIRAWRHFLKMRLPEAAHPDMRIVAKEIYDILVRICPNCFFDINCPTLPVNRGMT